MALCVLTTSLGGSKINGDVPAYARALDGYCHLALFQTIALLKLLEAWFSPRYPQIMLGIDVDTDVGFRYCDLGRGSRCRHSEAGKSTRSGETRSFERKV